MSGHHSQEHALAHPGGGENAHPLSLAAGQRAVDRPHPGANRLVDGRPPAGRRRRLVQRDAAGQGRLRQAVDRAALGVDYAAQQLRPHAEPARGSRQPHAVAALHSGGIVQRIQQAEIVAEADHLGPQRAARAAVDFGHRSHRRRKIQRRDRRPDGLGHAAQQRGGHDPLELCRHFVHGQPISSSSIRASWASIRWSIAPKRVSTRQPPRSISSSGRISTAPRLPSAAVIARS